ncbi:spermidine synthase [Aliidiomarina minuta]|uniref:spermidine synthase n=1 Tax=Aliidiomarina minuta TaxID=880057 RepID=UPI000F88E047|nr:hypothetical protein [Aliidiomarina minuta]
MTHPTDFEYELAKSSILYLTGDSEVRVVVLENQDYRFLVINGAIQSVLKLQDPKALVLPHQLELLAELPQLAPTARVLELGLGGGSALRHASYCYPQLYWCCLETNAEVINLYWEYFAPEQELAEHEIILSDSLEWLQKTPARQQFELILCDVYAEVQAPLLEACLGRLSADGVLMVNWLPHLQPQGNKSLDFFHWLSAQQNLQHTMQKVKGFRNQIHRLTKI